MLEFFVPEHVVQKKSGQKCASILYHVQNYQKSVNLCVSILYQKILCKKSGKNA